MMRRETGPLGMFLKSKWGQELIDNIPVVGDINREMTEFMSDLRTELKETVHETSPEIGKVWDQMERLSTTVENGTTSSTTKDFELIQTLIQKRKGIVLHAGDHLSVRRYFPAPYTHHGIYVGEGQVVHFSEGEIRMDELESFGARETIRKVHSPLGCTSEEVVLKAFVRLGEQGYNLIFNNCEHFALWCRSANYSTDNTWF